jgi:hypothetical protein
VRIARARLEHNKSFTMHPDQTMRQIQGRSSKTHAENRKTNVKSIVVPPLITAGNALGCLQWRDGAPSYLE